MEKICHSWEFGALSVLWYDVIRVWRFSSRSLAGIKGGEFKVDFLRRYSTKTRFYFCVCILLTILIRCNVWCSQFWFFDCVFALSSLYGVKGVQIYFRLYCVKKRLVLKFVICVVYIDTESASMQNLVSLGCLEVSLFQFENIEFRGVSQSTMKESELAFEILRGVLYS